MRFCSKTFRRRLSKSKRSGLSKSKLSRRVKRSKSKTRRQRGGMTIPYRGIPEGAVLANPLQSDAAGGQDQDAE